MKTFNRGFTLIELMVTVSIFAIVSTLAIPNIVQFFQKKNEVNETQKILAMMNEARQQAIRIKRNVTFHFNTKNHENNSLTNFYMNSNDLTVKHVPTIQFDMLGRVKYEPSLKCIDIAHTSNSNYRIKLEVSPLGEFSLLESDQGCFA